MESKNCCNNIKSFNADTPEIVQGMIIMAKWLGKTNRDTSEILKNHEIQISKSSVGNIFNKYENDEDLNKRFNCGRKPLLEQEEK